MWFKEGDWKVIKRWLNWYLMIEFYFEIYNVYGIVKGIFFISILNVIWFWISFVWLFVGLYWIGVCYKMVVNRLVKFMFNCIGIYI